MRVTFDFTAGARVEYSTATMKTHGLHIALLVACLLICSTIAAQTDTGFVRETESESIYQNRYENCDFGFLVKFRTGVIAHGTHSPSPNHGFLIGLPDTTTQDLVSFSNHPRVIWVNGEYDAMYPEWKSAQDVSHWRLDSAKREYADYKILANKKVLLAGHVAARFRWQHGGVIEEEVVALRHGIVYEVGLISTASHYLDDVVQFESILGGFRFAAVSHC